MKNRIYTPHFSWKKEARKVKYVRAENSLLYSLYFPIQKLEKIRPNKSSAVNSPVISERESDACRKSSATNSLALDSWSAFSPFSKQNFTRAKASRCLLLARKIPSA